MIKNFFHFCENNWGDYYPVLRQDFYSMRGDPYTTHKVITRFAFADLQEIDEVYYTKKLISNFY